MLNWIKFITVFLATLTTVIVVTVFISALKPLASEEDIASDAAIKSGQILSVDSVQLYNGTQSFMTVFGVNDKGEEIALFVDENTDKDFGAVKIADGITAAQAVATVKKELAVQKVLHVSLGVEEAGPVWEVAFKSDNGKLNYVYVYFESGQWWKRILNL